MDSHPVRNSQALQTALANAFCYVISSLDDSHVSVAQRAALYLGTIHDSAFAVNTNNTLILQFQQFKLNCPYKSYTFFSTYRA